MNRDRDLAPTLQGWFAADERDLPEDIRVAVLATIAAVPQRHRRPRWSWPTPTAPRRLRVAGRTGLLLALLALVALLAAALLLPFAGSSPSPARIVNGWIAFSSQPHDGQVIGTDIRRGGDIYLAHDRDDLRVLVSRGPGMASNVCPAFSPVGTRLAYGERAWRPGTMNPTWGDPATALVILDLAPHGSITHTSRLPIEPTLSQAPCPRWSTDGKRLGSLEGDSLVVRDLDGAIVEARDGDPTLADFAWSDPDSALPDSPSGELHLRSQDDHLIVHPADGSPDRTIAEGGGIDGWSPDSTEVLLISGAGAMSFRLQTVSVDEPFTAEVIADEIPTNGARSWPNGSDLSWQALSE